MILIPQIPRLISGDTKKDVRIWSTYHFLALKATREAIRYDDSLIVRPEESDSDLQCVKSSQPKSFSESLNAIILNIFAIEYRINRVAECKGISDKQVSSYIDENGGTNIIETKFKDLSLYQKWRNIVSILGKKATKKYLKSVERLKKWIRIRNKIAHGDYRKIQQMKISPRKAFGCFEAITKAIFELNVVLGYQKRKIADETCKKILLSKQ